MKKFLEVLSFFAVLGLAGMFANSAPIYFPANSSSSSGGASLTSGNTFTGGNVFSTFTVVSNSSSTFNGPVRLTKNAFVFGPGTAQASDAGDPGATSAYFQISRSGATNMAIELKQDTTTRSQWTVNSSNNVSLDALSGDLSLTAAGGQTLALKNNSVTQIAVGTSLITISTTTNHDGVMGLWVRTTVQLQGTSATRAFQMVGNSDTGDVCVSTGAGLSPWVLVRSTTTACD